MNKTMIEFNRTQRTADVPALKSGDVVKVYRKIIEGGKERVQMFEGMIIAMRGGQSSSPTITVRKVSNGIGVELVLPVHSPIIEKIEVVKSAKVRRSKLYFVRERSLKSLKLKYTMAEKAKGEGKKGKTESAKKEEAAASEEQAGKEMTEQE
ncbi:MAG TPA: 50S ribosomal protein L19 [Candidatus Moranbacteria bacterium]|nr:50S ribosomal protein L19 [Candidatus Moranbacteria bacterium]